MSITVMPILRPPFAALVTEQLITGICILTSAAMPQLLYVKLRGDITSMLLQSESYGRQNLNDSDLN